MNITQSTPPSAQSGAGAANARGIAKEAYLYGFPIVDGYRILYAYFVESGHPDFKAPGLGLDLRADPMVLTVPKIEQERYFSSQLIDLFTLAEAMYPIYAADAEGQPLDGAYRYTLRFAPGALPPVNAFRSLPMYAKPQSLVINPLDRYLINSPMLPRLAKDPDGGRTLLTQGASPGAGQEANWLPAPAGPFIVAMRLYCSADEALDGRWTAPPLQRTAPGRVP